MNGNAAYPISVIMTDMTGKLIYQTRISVEQLDIDVRYMPAGIYLITLTDKLNNIQTFKLIKQ